MTIRRKRLRIHLGSLRLWFAAAVVLAAAGPAHAHGVLERSDPAPNAALSTPPQQIVLYFSEPADPAFTRVDVLDGTGGRMSQSATFSSDRRRAIVALPPVPVGVYTVRWRAVWPSDGHTTSGFFLFAVGQAAPGPSASGETAPSPLRVILRSSHSPEELGG